jgi:hypothetical protein
MYICLALFLPGWLSQQRIMVAMLASLKNSTREAVAQRVLFPRLLMSGRHLDNYMQYPGYQYIGLAAML